MTNPTPQPEAELLRGTDIGKVNSPAERPCVCCTGCSSVLQNVDSEAASEGSALAGEPQEKGTGTAYTQSRVCCSRHCVSAVVFCSLAVVRKMYLRSNLRGTDHNSNHGYDPVTLVALTDIREVTSHCCHGPHGQRVPYHVASCCRK